jgi:hypothetical protein
VASKVSDHSLGRKPSDAEWSGSSLEICAPATSDVEFKYSWPIDNFIQQVSQTPERRKIDRPPTRLAQDL